MIHSTRAISLVLVSAVSVLGGYHAFKPAADYNDQDEWSDASTQPGGSHYGYGGYHSNYYHHYYGASHYTGGGYSSFGSSGFHSSSSMGTSHGGFGSTGHAAHS